MTHPKHLRRLVDFCCERHGCGHHIDGHGYGEQCYVPGCDCTGWRDHVNCDHRDETDPAGRLALAEAAVRVLKLTADRTFASVGIVADENADLRKQVADLTEQLARREREWHTENAALRARIADGLMVRCWTNEDGNRFAFAEDILAALDPEAAAQLAAAKSATEEKTHA